MGSFLPIAWRRCSRIDIYARSEDGTWRLERGMISDTSHHILSNVDCIELNILIDEDGNAQLADFGLLNIIPDSTYTATTTSSGRVGTVRWMSPELIVPARFGVKHGRPTKESDCYALGMVILEVLTGKVPFQDCNSLTVMAKVIEGGRPDRPKRRWFTDDLWGTLELCWLYKPKQRPAVESVLECLEKNSATWEPLSLSTDSDSQTDSGSQTDSDDDSASAMSYRACMFFYLVFDLDSPVQSSCSG